MVFRWWIFGALVAMGIDRLGAHQELYHNIDLDLREVTEAGVVKIAFTIHAPELLVGFSEAADAMFDSRWLEGRSDEELERLVALARVYLTERFQIRFDGRPPVDAGEDVGFEDFERMRGGGGRGLPPACIQATIELALPDGASELRLEHAASSEKRLMLVVYRPRQFPEASDVEPGLGAVVKLTTNATGQEVRQGSEGPEGTDRAGDENSAIYAAVVLAGLVVVGLLLARRVKGRAGKMG